MPKAKTGTLDTMTQTVYASVTESAVNTLTFTKLETGYGVLDRQAWVVQRIEWYPDYAFINECATATEYSLAALVTSNLISSLTLASAAVKDLFKYMINIQSGVGYNQLALPFIRDFTNLEGGGLIMLPNPLYIAITGSGGANVKTVACRIHFKWVDLTDEMWMQLVEATRLLT